MPRRHREPSRALGERLERRQRVAREIGDERAALAALVGWPLASGLHYLRVREELRQGKPAFVRAGPRDAFLLARGWGRLRRLENGFAREAGPGPAFLRLPLLGGHAYLLTLRLRPATTCAAPCAIEVALDGLALSRHSVEAFPENEGRFGSTQVALEAKQVRDGSNLLELRGGPVDFWLARVERQPH